MNAAIPKKKMDIKLQNVLMRPGTCQQAYLELSQAYGGERPDVKWFSSDQAVATVDHNGLIHAHGEGQITLVAELMDGNRDYAAIWLRVTDATEMPAEYRITFESGNGDGETFQITALEGLPILIPECPFTSPDGQYFCEWDMDGLHLEEGDSVDFFHDTTIQAVWNRA